MAAKQQKTTSRRKTPVKKKTSSGNTRKKTPDLTPEEKIQQAGIRDEVVVLTILALSILLVLSNFNLCGKLGTAISNVTFGLFGLMAYFIFYRQSFKPDRKDKAGGFHAVLFIFNDICTYDFRAL